MRCAVWFAVLGLPNVTFDLPYSTRSPVLSTKVRYETLGDVLEEIERVINEAEERNYKLGESLYYQMPFFCDPSKIISDWCWDMITDYNLIKQYNIPLSSDLNSIDVFTLDCFNIISEEIKNIEAHKRSK